MRGRDLWNSSYFRFVLLGLPEASRNHGEVSTADMKMDCGVGLNVKNERR